MKAIYLTGVIAAGYTWYSGHVALAIVLLVIWVAFLVTLTRLAHP